MNYLSFLLVFVAPPLALLVFLNRRAHARGRFLSAPLRSWPGYSAVLLHMVIALVYTTPWDNYLVSQNVWGYAPDAVLGVIGLVPIEEYAFIVLQAALTGAWLIWLGRWRFLVVERGFRPRPKINRGGAMGCFVLWVVFLILAVLAHVDVHVKPITYLSLIFLWALPPLALQLWYGADILFHYRRLVVTALLTTSFYLSLADTFALAVGTWEIRQYTKTGIHVWPYLPIEEFSFFLATNMLVVFGITLMLARETQPRIPWPITNLMSGVFGRRSEDPAGPQAP